MIKAIVHVWLKPGITNPVGEQLKKDLRAEAISVVELAAGKFFELEIATDSREWAIKIATEAAEELLANKTVERFEVTV